jgi:cellulose synthase/poly-beta-1,6-N-acetylglucosamine synthase-like glycosyltransferase
MRKMTMTTKRHRPHQALIYLIIATSAAFLYWYVSFLFTYYHIGQMQWVEKIIFFFKLPVEIVSSLYSIAFLLVGVTYLFLRQKPTTKKQLHDKPPVGLIYLCYNDLDEEALGSLMTLSYDGKIFLIIHDDSTDTAVNAETDRVARHLASITDHIDIRVLRRKNKAGSKAGAMNYVLDKTAHLFDYFILCDNDSTILQPDIIERSLSFFEDNEVAIVQFRSLGIVRKDYCKANFILRKSIDAFHANMSVYSRFGWQPFIGHNAILRTAAVRDVGGFTPGFFSDDLDITVRLNLKGYSVIYGHDLRMGETHPPNYTAFRKRSYKWSYGCMQSLKAHAWSIIKSRLSLAEKCFFFLFTAHYVMSIFLFLYMVVNFMIAPFFIEVNPFGVGESVVAGCMLILVIFFPFLSYFIRMGQVKQAIKPIVLGALVYGTTDFDSMRGTIDCLLGKKRKWIPTNLAGKGKLRKKIWLEPLFGVIMMIIPLITKMSLLFLPSTYLFAGKFLFVPALQLAYNDKEKVQNPVRTRRRHRVVGMFLISALLFFVPEGIGYGQEHHVEVRGNQIFKNDSPLKIKGINYGPWRPETGPNKKYQYPTPAQIDKDLDLIKEANANTILVYDPPAYVLEIAEKKELQVFCTFAINWYGLDNDSTFNAQKTAIVEKVNVLKQSNALLGWVVGNEIPENALLKYGYRFYEEAIKRFYDAIKKVDAVHPVTHSNWPLAKSLKLSFLDIISFNVYPVWPTEVISRGYGNYIRDILKPIAGSKPLLITEFGINSLEGGDEGQARTIKSCWEEIKKLNICGGMVFSFADEWWKNYDNPVRPDNYWLRQPSSNDEATHDEDPEEYYGLMTSDRKPKKAYYAVKRMYAENNVFLGNIISIPGALVLALIIIAAYFTYRGAVRKS